MALDDLLNRINSMTSFDTRAEVQGIVAANSQRLTELEQEQLSYGIGRDGKARSDEYRPLTKFIKKTQGVGLGAVTDRVTFFMSGRLYASLFTTVKNGYYSTESPLPTYKKMLDRIGKDNYGLDEGQRLVFAEEVLLPQFSIRYNEVTGIKI